MTYTDIDINEECENFCLALGAENWGAAQINSMSAAFYAGAMVSFNALSNASVSDNDEDIAVERMERFHDDILDNIEKQNVIMQKIWKEKGG